MLEFCQKSSTFAVEMNNIIRDSAKLLTANVVAQAIGLLVYPILTRLYSPDDFGLLNLFLSIGGVLVLLSTAEYQYAIVLPKDDNKARAVTQVGLMVLSIVTVIILLSLPFSGSIGTLFKAPGLANWWWLMPIYVAALGGWTLLNYYYTRQGQFTRISGYQISQSVLNSGLKVGFGYSGFLSGGLIVSSVLGPVLALCGSIVLGWRKCLSALRLRCSYADLKQAAKEYGKFPKYDLPRSLVNMLSGNLPAFMLTPFFGLTELGFFSMAMVLAFRPINMVCMSIYQVLYRQIAEKVNLCQRITPILRRYLGWMMLITIPTFVVLYWFLPWLTSLILGSNYAISGVYIRSMLIWLLMVLMATTINFIPDIFGKQRIMMWVETVYCVLRVIVLFIGIRSGSFILTLRLYFYVSALVLAGELIWFMWLSHSFDKQLDDGGNIVK